MFLNRYNDCKIYNGKKRAYINNSAPDFFQPVYILTCEGNTESFRGRVQ